MVAILSSCAGYGTYVPSLLLSDALNKKGISNKVFVYEYFFDSYKRTKFLEYRNQFHKNFRFAKMASDVSSTISDEENYKEVYKKIESFNCNFFVVMFGSWINIIHEFNIPKKNVFCLRLDVVDTPSWLRSSSDKVSFNTEWLIGKDTCMPNYLLCKDLYCSPIKNRIIMHGGGWGINNFSPIAEKLIDKYEINAILSTKQEATDFKSRFDVRTFYMPIEWMPDESTPYPPLVDYESGKLVSYRNIARKCCAMISKPGGGTCLDALLMKVPPIFLQGMAKHEIANSISMIENHFGYSFDMWEKQNFSYDIINQIHDNLIQKTSYMSYIADYLEEFI